MPKKKKTNFALLGIILLFAAFFAIAMILIGMPRGCVSRCGDGVCQESVCEESGCSCAESPKTCSSDCGEKDYGALASSAVTGSSQFVQLQGNNLKETGKRYVSEGEWEYIFSFESGNLNISPGRKFEARIRVANQSAEIIEIKSISGFCGSSTYDSCSADSDCVTGGCSRQVCQSKTTEPVFTTCEYRECYNAQFYEVICKCVEGKCRWI